jgi:hypothetical protein
MAGKVIKGIVKSLDDILESGYLPKGVTVNSIPKRIPKVRRVEPNKFFSSDGSGPPPLRQMYHGTSTPVDYDSPKGSPEIGLHLADNPDVSAEYAFMPNTGNAVTTRATQAGPRIFPMLVDQGNMLPIRTTDFDWWSPELFEDAARFAKNPTEANRVTKFANSMRPDESVIPAMKRQGIDSLEYLLSSNYSKEPNTALLLRDPSRAVPKFSPTGQSLAKVRGVLAAQPSTITNEEFAKLYGPNTIENIVIPGLFKADYEISRAKYLIKQSSDEEVIKGAQKEVKRLEREREKVLKRYYEGLK